MKEERVFFKSGILKIEGLYLDNPGNNGVIITHPHPQMGGTMNNNVVDALVSVFSAQNYSTLRFNFRGVGCSEGIYDNGRGEMQDVIAARGFFLEKEKRNLTLAGYSFGAIVNLNVFDQLEQVDNIVLISPPINNGNLNIVNTHHKKGLIICGDEDQFCKIYDVKRWSEKLDFQFKIIEGADHFYWGMDSAIMKYINDYLYT